MRGGKGGGARGAKLPFLKERAKRVPGALNNVGPRTFLVLIRAPFFTEHDAVCSSGEDAVF